MNSSKIFRFKIPTFIFVMLLLISLACGSNATPEQVGRVEEQPAAEQPEPVEPAEQPTESAEQPAEPASNEAAEQPAESTQENNEQPAGPQTFEVGDIVSIGDSILVVLGWEEVPGNDFAKPDEGKKFLAVELLLVNQSGSPASVSSLLQMSLKDSSAQAYKPDLLAIAAIDSAGVDGELSPGERIRGKVGFQIPSNVQGLQFVFDANIFGTGKVFVNLGDSPVSVEPPAEVAGETAQQAFAIGDIVNIGDSVLVVLGWEEVPGNDFAKPDEGNKFIAVEVLVVNRSDAPAAISTALQMTVKDSTGQSYKPDLMASTATDSSNVDGELSPGERVRGKVSFQVPVDVQNLQFIFDASVFGTGKVFVDLGAQPTSVEPPAEVVGETAQQTFAVGDIIEIGEFSLIVNEVTSPAGDDFNKPDEGKKFVVVDVTVENKSSSPKAISSLLQMNLKDATGQTYDVDLLASAAAGGSTPDGELAPGEKIRGQIGYQVPVDATGLVFVFDASIFGTGKVNVALP